MTATSQMSPPKTHNIFIAKQPIVDTDESIVAYELLFRSKNTDKYDGVNPDASSAQLMANALHMSGIIPSACRQKVFVNLPRLALLNETYKVMPSANTVFELLEDVLPQPDVVAACQKLVRAGYQLALDDFVFDPSYEPLLQIAEYVKVDFQATGPDLRLETARRLAMYRCKLLAEKVETRGEVNDARSQGYTLFQGYFYAKPKIEQDVELTTSDQVRIELLQLVGESSLRFDVLESTIKKDAAIALKLLRYLNNASRGIATRITSLKQALTMLGEDIVRKWVPMAVFTSSGRGGDSPIVRDCIIRAKFCESIAGELNEKSRQLDYFRLGLFSGIESIYAVSLDEMLQNMAIAVDVRIALLGGNNRMGASLKIAQHLEQGRWFQAEFEGKSIGLGIVRIRDFWYEAQAWFANFNRD